MKPKWICIRQDPPLFINFCLHSSNSYIAYLSYGLQDVWREQMNEEQIKERLRELMPQLDDDVSVHKLLLKLETVLFDTQTSYDIEKIHSTETSVIFRFTYMDVLTLRWKFNFKRDDAEMQREQYWKYITRPSLLLCQALRQQCGNLETQLLQKEQEIQNFYRDFPTLKKAKPVSTLSAQATHVSLEEQLKEKLVSSCSQADERLALEYLETQSDLLYIPFPLHFTSEVSCQKEEMHLEQGTSTSIKVFSSPAKDKLLPEPASISSPQTSSPRPAHSVQLMVNESIADDAKPKKRKRKLI